MGKTYLATEATVTEIRDYVTPTNLESVQISILDFTDPNLHIISGGFDSESRTIRC